MMFALGRAKELGYPTDALVAWLAPNIIGQLTSPDYEPYLIASNRTPTVSKPDIEPFANWRDVRSMFPGNFDAKKNFTDRLRNANHGYSIIAIAATAAAAGEPGGGAAWKWIYENAVVPAKRGLDVNPKWAIVPRESVP
jgi:hypothetical protein